ncbi:magnesium chelatase subunit H [Acuticoccus kandeliae]|uniref:magnesium chelatase subunit H n=1 Tax=Acuticoccus kandeliae TaxID=2073160 RepID=UPI000D3E4F1D|nr:magnesium chelatase subunit H [Acuticoccus kandeliae]
MRKPTSAVDATPVRVAIITLDSHLAGIVERAAEQLSQTLPGLVLTLHAASTWQSEPQELTACREAIARADIIVASMLFIDEHISAVLPDLEARRDDCDAMVCLMSAGEIIRLTRMGRFEMGAKDAGIVGLLKRLRGSSGRSAAAKSSGASQMRMLRRLPKILRFIPGTAQDVRAYFIAMQYWLASSDENVAALVRFLVSRYARGVRETLSHHLDVPPPTEYPEVGLYHPRLATRMTETLEDLPRRGTAGTIGILIMRAYVLSGDTAHYDGVIDALEAKGFNVVPAFASGLDSRPAIDRYFTAKDGSARIDALVSLTGFSLVGGPAYNNASAAEDLLARLDVPYIVAQPLEFQTLEEWDASPAGLLPIEATIMVAIPELDGAAAPTVFGGRSSVDPTNRHMQPSPDRCARLAERVEKMVALRRTPRSERRIAVVLFNFPPNAGAAGTAAYLAVYESLFNTLTRLAAEGYTVTVPDSVDALRAALLTGNAARHGTDGNVHALIPADDHVRREPHLAEIETQWGPAPGRALTDGRSIFVLGARFGNVFVGLQPGFGYEGDPMRLLFEKGFAPTHAFSAFYRWLREDYRAHAVLHFGTHGALEFMPGKQVGLSRECWPDRLIGAMPNLYLYAANNPSEGLIAKRRAGATLVSYLTPAVTQAGLYRGLLDLKGSLDRWRQRDGTATLDESEMAALIQAQASAIDLAAAEPAWTDPDREIAALRIAMHELEETLIPDGLHIVGAPLSEAARADLLAAMAEAKTGARPAAATIDALMAGRETPLDGDVADALRTANRLLGEDHELPAIVRALDGRFIRPVAGGDVIRTPDVLPTGRNVHGFDPFRIPSAFAMADGAVQAARVLARHTEAGAALPETVAFVLWGTDNLKSEGGAIAQVLALLGARPRFDSYGRLAGAVLAPLDDLDRPRIDVMMTLSGIFRDLLPLQMRLLAEASWLAATADEPVERNFVRKHALAEQAATGTDIETASLRVFSNAGGAYGSNVAQLVDSSAWTDADELAETYTRRKSFAYGRDGRAAQHTQHLGHLLSHVDLAYQNLESVELGVTTVDHYFDTLGGISRAVTRSRGASVPVYIGDQTRGTGKVRTLSEQVALETHTRMLNPKWTEGMLKHGYEGVRQIEAHVTNVVGWSATTGKVQPWVYRRLSETYVLDPEMRARMAKLNPAASARVANRLIEAHERNYWQPDAATLAALRDAGDELEDILEGVGPDISVEEAA